MKSILTPRQLADAIGVSESSVKRWVDDGHIRATRTAGGHRRIGIQEAVRYIRRTSANVVRPEVLGLADVGTPLDPGGGREDAGEMLLDYLRSGAASEARGLVLSLYLEGRTVAQIIDGPLSFAMERIGELWTANPSGIYWEHRATQIAIQAVGRLRLLLGPREGAPCAVGGVPSGDPYILPSLATAAVLEGEGLRAVDLGPDTPLASLELGAEDQDARLVWLSVSVAADPGTLRSEVIALGDRLAERGAILAVGGREAASLALPRSDSLYVGRSMAELEALVRGMRLPPRP